MAITRFKNSSIANKGPKYDSMLAGLPYRPIIGTATDGGNGTSVSVAFTGNNPAGAGITYTALSSPGSLTATGPTSPITVTGLTAGTEYTFQVKASNSLGDSAYSAASNAVTPVVPTYTLSQTFTNTQNWTIPNGVSQIAVYAFGGGAGGNAGFSGGNYAGGGGGGGGGGAFQDFTVTPGTTYLVTIGAGGNGGDQNNTPAGGNGTASSFGNLLNSGFGTNSNRTYNYDGGNTNTGSSNVSGAVFMSTGAGGNGGVSSRNAPTAGNVGTNPNGLTLNSLGLTTLTYGGGGGGGGYGGNKLNTNGTQNGSTGRVGADVSNGAGGTGGNGGNATISSGTPSANAGTAGSAANGTSTGGGGGGGGGSATNNNNFQSANAAGGVGGAGTKGVVIVYTR